MERIAIENLDADPVGDESERRRLSGALGTTDVAINHYRIAPGEEFPAGLHAHADQEELFVVQEGTATFETYRPVDDGSDRARGLAVSTGEAVRFAPGEFQSGRNDGDRDLVVLAIGAP